LDKDSMRREEGDEWAVGGGTTCTCSGGHVSCTEQDNKFKSTQDDKLECGFDVEKNRTRVPGDSWSDGCNQCRCLGAGVKACTKRKCETEQDNKLKTAQDDKLECGFDAEKNRTRVPGDSWSEECNRCRCLGAGVKACTKRKCETEVTRTSETNCEDTEGQTRLEGESWTLPDGFNNCTCSRGLPICTRLIGVTDKVEQNLCGEDRKEGDSWKVDCNTCNCVSTSQSPVCTEIACLPNSDGCTDKYGNSRNSGESWKEECNTCRCRKGRKSCTRKFCLVEEDTELVYLLEADNSKDVQKISQCKQEAVNNCESVKVDLDLVRSVKTGDVVHLMENSNISMRVSSVSSSSVQFQVVGGGEATLTTGGQTSSSVYGTVRPHGAGVIFYIESCGEDCSVLYQRSLDFFNDQEDR